MATKQNKQQKGKKAAQSSATIGDEGIQNPRRIWLDIFLCLQTMHHHLNCSKSTRSTV
jgi:hypothetical protein